MGRLLRWLTASLTLGAVMRAVRRRRTRRADDGSDKKIYPLW